MSNIHSLKVVMMNSLMLMGVITVIATYNFCVLDTHM